MIESITRRCSTMHVSTNIPPPATSITSTRTTAFLPAVRQEQLTALRQVGRRPREQARPARQRPVHPLRRWRARRPWELQALTVLHRQPARRQQHPLLPVLPLRQKQPLHREAGAEPLVKKAPLAVREAV